MITLRCTRRVLDILNDPINEHLSEPTAALGEWYVNLIPVEHLAAYILVNSATLLTILLPAAKLYSLIPALPQRASRLLHRLGVPERLIEEETAQMLEAQIAKTASRSVLGSMNDLTVQVQYMAEIDEYDDIINLDDVEFRLSQIPYKSLGYKFPSEALEELLERRYGSDSLG
jgi:hypothetical protein